MVNFIKAFLYSLLAIAIGLLFGSILWNHFNTFKSETPKHILDCNIKDSLSYEFFRYRNFNELPSVEGSPNYLNLSQQPIKTHELGDVSTAFFHTWGCNDCETFIINNNAFIVKKGLYKDIDDFTSYLMNINHPVLNK